MRLGEINSPGELAIDPDLIQRFTDRGWEIMGEGRDQMVFMKPGTNTVLKIVGQGSLPRQAEIRRYVNFFRAFQRNPHFPRVGPDRELTWKGRKYYAYTQERLRPLPGDEAVMDYLESAMGDLGHGEEPDLARVPPGLSVEDIEGLTAAVDHMFQSGLGGQYGFDLSNLANIMQRDNGQLVIVDPFSSFDDENLTEKINPETMEPGFVVTRRMKNGYIIRARGKKRYSDMPDDIGIEVEIIDPNYHERYPVADARFKAKQDPDTGEWFLSSLSTGTLEKYRRQGLASAMYNFARALGNDLRASRIQSRAGEDFWKKGGAGQGRPLQLEPEVNLVAEVKLLAKVKGKGADLSNLPRGGREIPQGRELEYLGRRQADLGPYEIWRDYLGGQVSYHLWNPTTRRTIITAFGSRYHRNPHSFIVSGLYAAPGNPIRAAEFYRALVRDLGLTLISDRKQSPGGQSVWQQLEKFPDVEVYGFDTRTGKVLNIGAGDEEMYSVPSSAVAGSQDMARVARDIRLVATAK